MIFFAFVAAVYAQEPAAVGAAPPVVAPAQTLGPDDYDEEVIVWGEHAVRQARAAIVRKMEDLGWRAREKDGATLFKPPESWLGKAWLYRDGSLAFGDPVIALDSVGGKAHTYDPGASIGPEDAAATAGSMDVGLTTADMQLDPDPGLSSQAVVRGSFYVLPSGRVLAGRHAEIQAAVEPDLRRYRAVLWETEVRLQLEALADRLDALWASGAPLDGGDPISGQDARRRAALDFWATRADTVEGEQVAQAARIWLRETVMDSDFPVTAEEEAEFEARSGRKLDLVP
jgi:hypothetical protein